jgi:hypothetical protein
MTYSGMGSGASEIVSLPGSSLSGSVFEWREKSSTLLPIGSFPKLTRALFSEIGHRSLLEFRESRRRRKALPQQDSIDESAVDRLAKS